jgi:serine/threonine-protein kinase HipA
MIMDVWLEACDTPVGTLERAKDKFLTFTYADGADARHRISLSLPVRKGPYHDASSRGYFANLLFEGPQLDRVVDSFKLDRDDYGAILWHLGGDCPGAISVTPAGSGPGKTPGRFPEDYEPIEDSRLHEIVTSLHKHKRMPDGERDPSPIAGVQGKIAVLALKGRYYLPNEGSRAPTTHILKVSPADDPHITDHEVALLRIAQAVGIKTAESKAITFNVGALRINAILSTRFDRDIEGGAGRVTRVHSEDFCQALGLPPSLKYERGSDNPDRRFCVEGLRHIAEQATVPLVFIRDVFQHILFNLLVGNSDNHGKNGSILHRDGGTVLAPLYDVVPVFMDRSVTHQLAFHHGTAEFAEDVTQDNLHRVMMDLGFRSPKTQRTLGQIKALAQGIAAHAKTVAPKSLADGLFAQAMVVGTALNTKFDLPARDYVDRLVRDEHTQRAGGWGGMS